MGPSTRIYEFLAYNPLIFAHARQALNLLKKLPHLGLTKNATTKDKQIKSEATQLNMQAFIIETNTQILPFGEQVGDMPVGGTNLREWQTNLLKKFGFSVSYVSSLEEVSLDGPRLIT